MQKCETKAVTVLLFLVEKEKKPTLPQKKKKGKRRHNKF